MFCEDFVGIPAPVGLMDFVNYPYECGDCSSSSFCIFSARVPDIACSMEMFNRT